MPAPGEIYFGASEESSVGIDSPDLNPIEQLFAKLKALLRKAAARTRDAALGDHRPSPRSLHLAQEPLEAVPVDQRRNPLQLPVCPHGHSRGRAGDGAGLQADSTVRTGSGDPPTSAPISDSRRVSSSPARRIDVGGIAKIGDAFMSRITLLGDELQEADAGQHRVHGMIRRAALVVSRPPLASRRTRITGTPSRSVTSSILRWQIRQGGARRTG